MSLPGKGSTYFQSFPHRVILSLPSFSFFLLLDQVPLRVSPAWPNPCFFIAADFNTACSARVPSGSSGECKVIRPTLAGFVLLLSLWSPTTLPTKLEFPVPHQHNVSKNSTGLSPDHFANQAQPADQETQYESKATHLAERDSVFRYRLPSQGLPWAVHTPSIPGHPPRLAQTAKEDYIIYLIISNLCWTLSLLHDDAAPRWKIAVGFHSEDHLAPVRQTTTIFNEIGQNWFSPQFGISPDRSPCVSPPYMPCCLTQYYSCTLRVDILPSDICLKFSNAQIWHKIWGKGHPPGYCSWVESSHLKVQDPFTSVHLSCKTKRILPARLAQTD